MPDVLIYGPDNSGGLAEYMYCQGRSLAEAGASVVALVTPDFLGGRVLPFGARANLLRAGKWRRRGFLRRVTNVAIVVLNEFVLAWNICLLRPRIVLLSSYREYWAPLWIWPHLVLALFGQRYVANLHDPVRDYRLGPSWWHRWSIQLAYLPIEAVLVHAPPPAAAKVPSRVGIVSVPHGLYFVAPPACDRREIRQGWGVRLGEHVLLALGYLRANKNIELAIEALAGAPGTRLVIAGTTQSSADKPMSYYRARAGHFGVSDRVCFCDGFVADAEVGNYFAGADGVLLTYAASFQSQSGVLNLAAAYRRPVLASGGPASFITLVTQFSLGEVVTPDSVPAITEGMNRLARSASLPRWEDYARYADWAANARAILELCENGNTSTRRVARSPANAAGAQHNR